MHKISSITITCRLTLVAVLLLLTNACVKVGVPEGLGALKFDGINDVIQDPNGDYVISWNPATIDAYKETRFSYTILQMPMLDVESFNPGINPRVIFDAGKTPADVGTTVSTVSDVTSYTLRSESVASNQAVAFQVRAKTGEGTTDNNSVVYIVRSVPSPTLALVSGSLQIVAPGGKTSRPLRVVLQQNKVPVAKETVWFEISSGSAATLETETIETDAQGYAETTLLTSNKTGDVVVTAHWKSQSVDFLVSVRSDDESGGSGDAGSSVDDFQLMIISGNNQRTTPGTIFTQPIQVQAVKNGLPVANEIVTFSQLSGPVSTFSGATSTTGQNGLAAITVRPDGTTGTVAVKAMWRGQSVQFSLIVANESLVIVSGNLQSAEPNNAFGQVIKVQLLRDGSPVANEVVSFTNPSGATVSFAAALDTTDNNGYADVAVTAGATQGTAIAQATWGAINATFSLSVISNKSLTILSGNNQTVAPGTAIAIPLTVQAMNNGAPVVGDNVTFAVTNSPNGTFSALSPLTDASGIAQTVFTPTAASNGITTIAATWNSTTVTFTVNVVNDELTLLSGTGQAADPSTAFSQSLRVRVYRNGAPLAGQSVTFTQQIGSVAVVLGSPTATSDVNGEASSAVTAGSVQGAATIRASWNGHTVDFALTVSLDEHLNIIAGNLQSTAPGQNFQDQLKVQVVKNGTPVVGTTVAFAVQSGAGASISTPSATTDATGVAQTVVAATATSGSTTVRASWHSQTADFTLTTVTQTNTNIAILSGNNQAGAPGATLASPMVVEVRDGTTSAIMQNVLVRLYVTAGNGHLNTTENSVDVITNVSGQASASFTLGTIAGANTVRALIVGNPTAFVDFTATTTVNAATAVDLGTTSLSASPASLTADGIMQSTLTLTSRDQYGNVIPNTTGVVVFSATAGTLLGSVTKNNDGTWTQQLRAPSTRGSGSLTVSATFDAAPLTSTPLSIGLISGNVDPSQSTIAVSPVSITANGSSTATVTVTLRDAFGNALTTGGETVVIQTTAGTLIGSGVADNNDGTYSRSIRSNTIAQTVTLSATVGGITIGGTTSLVFSPGAVSLANSSIQVSPSTMYPNGTSTATTTVILRDANNNQLTSGGATVAISSTAGTWVGAVVDGANGTYQKILRAASSDATAVITATVNGSPLPSNAIIYMSSGTSGPSIQTSLVEIVGGTSAIAADGTTTATVRVTLKDTSGTQMTSGGSNVVIATTAGTLLGSVLDNGNGTYTQLIRAAAASSTATISASFDGQTINSNTQLRFYGAFSVTTSTVSTYPESVQADGTSTTTVVIQAKDATGISIPVGGVTGLALSSTAGTLLTTLSDNGNGTYTQSLQAPGAATNATVTATKDATPLSDGATVAFFTASNLAGSTIDCSNIGSYTGTNIVVSGGTLTMNSFGTAASGVDCAASFVFGAVIVSSGGIITHTAATAAQEYRLEFSATSLSIDATSSIDVSGKGYLPQNTTVGRYRSQGNQIVTDKIGTSTGAARGGTHAGEGNIGSNQGGAIASKTYGSIFEPADLGASGGEWNGSYIGRAGGGRVKITITSGGTLSNLGTITAEGAPTSDHGGAGAGGSIWITTPTISGSGTITANGGAGTGGGAGGGGRIAIYYTTAQGNFTPASAITNVTTCGGTGTGASVGNWDGAAGTVYLKAASQTYGDLIVYNCNKTNLGGALTVINGPAAVISDAMTSTSLTKANAFGDTYTNTKMPYVGFQLDPNIAQIASPRKAQHTLFRITSGTKDAVTVASGNMTAIGTPTVDTFQLALVFDSVEIGGKAVISSSVPLVATKGDLASANDISMVIRGIPPVWLETPGSTSLTVDLATAGSASWAPTLTDFGTTTVTLKNGTFTSSALVASALTLDAATVTPTCLKDTACITTTGTLTLTNNATLQQAATTTTTEYALNITAAALNLGTGSTITAAGKGYIYGASSQGLSVTYGFVSYNGGNPYGGSHGGRGGGNSPTTYGSLFSPNESGSSGARWDASGGAGGGIIRINLNGGVATIDGIIDANGGDGRSGGAGGSVYLHTGTVTGGGTLRATGGNATNHAGGGGGRIALHYTSTSGAFSYPASILGRLQAYSGTYTSATYGYGAAGTIFLKGAAQTYGDLYINNNNYVTAASSTTTYINMPAPSVSTGLTATTLTDAGRFAEFSTYNTGHLLGFCINPNTAQNATLKLDDNTCYPATTQTVDTLQADNIAIGTAGDPYQVTLVLDNLELTGKALLESSGPILVKNGDITGNSSNTFTASGGMIGSGTYGVFEMANLSTATINTNGYGLALNTIDSTGNWSITGATMTSAGPIVAGSLTLDSTAFTPPCLKNVTCIALTGALTLQNASSIIQKATTTSIEYALEVVAGSLNVDGTSTMSAAGKGYTYTGSTNLNGTGYPNVTIVSSGISGGSHGGVGGNSNKPTYGSLFSPNESGNTGTYWTGAPGNGGGIIRLNLGSGAVVIDGTLDGSGTTGASGGAGGSIYIKGGAFSGTGTVKANGGNGNQHAGGGGGRIALHYTSASGGFAYPTSFIARLQAYSGTYSSATYGYGAAGTIFLKSAAQTYGDLYINNNNYVPVSTATSTSINIPSETASSALSATSLTASGFSEAGFLTGHLVGYSINPNTAQNATATWTDDTMFVIDSHDMTTLTTTSGDMTSIAASGNNTRVALVLDNLEVVGKAILETTGAILVKGGDLSSNTNDSATTSGTITGSGSVEYQGLASATFNANATTLGLAPISMTGALTLTNGTFNVSSISAGSVTLSSGTFNVNSITTTGNATFDTATVNSGTSGFSPNISVGGTLTLQNTSTLKSTESTGTTEMRLYIIAQDLTLGSGSFISADGTGYERPSSGTGTRSLNGVIYTGPSAGGSHGGRGGRGSASYSSTDPYGSFKQPLTLGSSGRNYDSSNLAGDGGGAIRIVVANTFTTAGIVTANGTVGTAIGGGGAGGSIWITTNTLTGTGTFRANGALSTHATLSGAGSGGRVALHYTNLGGSYTEAGMYALATAYGASGGGTSSSSAGTVFTKSAAQSYGNLIINNNNLTTDSAYTYTMVPQIASSTTDSITATTLSANNAFANGLGNADDILMGYSVNPRITQNATSTIQDDTFFEITGNSAHMLTIGSGSMIAAPVSAQVGDTFRVVLDLDNLEVRGKARLNLTGMQIRVRDGDVSSNNTSSFVLDGDLRAHTVDVNGAVWSTTANASETITLKCTSTSACP